MTADGWPSIRLVYPGVGIVVASNDGGHLAWLEEFMGPDFATAAPGPADHTVVLQVDTREYLRLWRRGPDPSGLRVDAFLLDSSTVRLPLWSSSGVGDVTVLDEEYRVFYVVSADRRRVRLVAARFGLLARNSLMRVVRELAMIATRRAGALVVHGAGVLLDGAGYVLAGARKAGKTTLLLHLLARADARYVANDRVVVAQDVSGEARLHGMPTIVTVRDRTARTFPAFWTALVASGFHAWSTLDETARRGRRRRAPSPAGWPLSAVQLTTLLGVPRAAGGPLEAILLPRVSGAPGGIALRRLAAEDALDRLRQSVFRARAGTGRGMLEAPGARDDAALREDACRRLVQHVPCLDCALGRHAYREPADVLDGLASAVASPR